VYPDLHLCPLRPSSCPPSIRHQTSVTEHALRRSIGSRHRHVSNGNMNGTWTITSVDQSLIYRQQVRQVVKFSKATKEQLDLIVHVLRKASIRCARSGATVTIPQLVQSTFGFFCRAVPMQQPVPPQQRLAPLVDEGVHTCPSNILQWCLEHIARHIPSCYRRSYR
jgi:hypothetical protein